VGKILANSIAKDWWENIWQLRLKSYEVGKYRWKNNGEWQLICQICQYFPLLCI